MSDYISQTITVSSCQSDISNQRRIKTPCITGMAEKSNPPGGGAIKQRIQSSHMPPCHRHMITATNFSSMFDLLLCSTPQAWADCCLELTAVSGYRMFLGPFG